MIRDELAYVVDDNDNVITTKKRGDILLTERERIVAIWVENLQGEVLIAKRASTMKHDPGLWGPSAAGGVKVGSNYEQTAIEELSEELGLTIQVPDLVLKGKMIYETKKNGKRMCAVFKVISDWPIEKFQIEPTEVDEIKWITKSNLENDIKRNPAKYLASADLWPDHFN